MLIRKANPSDALRIAKIYNQYLGVSTMDLVPYTIESVTQTMQQQNDREQYLILELNEAVIGWGQIKKYSDRKGYQYACETAVYIDQKHLSKGLGTQLKKSVIELCKDLDYKHLVAKIQADNDVSIHYNEQLGYEMVGIQKRIGFVNGVWKDVAIMQLLLDESTQP